MAVVVKTRVRSSGGPRARLCLSSVKVALRNTEAATLEKAEYGCDGGTVGQRAKTAEHLIHQPLDIFLPIKEGRKK